MRQFGDEWLTVVPLKYYAQVNGYHLEIMAQVEYNTPYSYREISRSDFINIAQRQRVNGKSQYEQFMMDQPQIFEPNACTDYVVRYGNLWPADAVARDLRLVE